MTQRTAVAAVASALIFVVMLVGYLVNWAWLHDFDMALLQPFSNFGLEHPAWVRAWDWISLIGSPMVFRLITLGLIVWFAVRREARTAVFLLLTVELSALLTQGVKEAVDRPRPATALVHATSTSFPSGHALGVMVCVLALLTVLLPRVAAQWRTPLIVLGVVLVVVIGVARVVLNVHHPSDVLAGWALGYLYYLVCLPVLRVEAEKPAALDTST
ncbi:phosphatase PAP2 family protein [Mycobacterium sp. ACS4331]|uniref:phosphatase PAP2 family protein n=1 Tax=Mycobacterium sp. ACS4331 TaxID=1834121 RepID=UPI000801A3C0|nr:phosphatase PAP2 family protein [Mycobacterium sp. ACS4331]OBF16378.1 hypothetical protein A5727_13730 [Mycobacterium sp. ACS4331]